MSACTTAKTKGFYFGYFWAMYMSSQIVGNCVGAVIIKRSMGSEFFIILSVFEVLACLGFVLVRMPTEIED